MCAGATSSGSGYSGVVARDCMTDTLRVTMGGQRDFGLGVQCSGFWAFWNLGCGVVRVQCFVFFVSLAWRAFAKL